MSYALGLPAALARRGLTVETVPGWQTRSAGSFAPHGAVCHWTAGPATGDRPSLSVVVNGHTSLAGPLANVFLSRGGVAVVVAAGRANHAGEGGWRGLAGNSSVFGTEAENSGFDAWTPQQIWSYPRINAAYCDLGGFEASMVCGHSEWAPTRKIDIRTWPGGMAGMRASVMALLTAGPQGGNDVFDQQAQDFINTKFGKLDADISARFAALKVTVAAESTSPQELDSALQGLATTLGPQVAAKLKESGVEVTVDPAVFEQAVKDALMEGIGSA